MKANEYNPSLPLACTGDTFLLGLCYGLVDPWREDHFQVIDFMTTRRAMDIRSYAMVTVSYWGFTLTDGALRMLVLLRFHELGYTPVHLAFLFLLYEF